MKGLKEIEQLMHTSLEDKYNTFILNAAIHDSRCIIVSRTRFDSELLRRKYLLLKEDINQKKSLMSSLGLKKDKIPKFVSINYDFTGESFPVIYDYKLLLSIERKLKI